ncbi:hypothetical protein KC343_g13626 [Hortaea werneckii]|nr:hypothetical protein KC352_g23896 [Hortaea werneckii]KAI7551393.1 hypothetical protein KC317_g14017 [Hortaea werneckii]KAI7601057.1 hypothetical protein KC346_g12990 [Hortaea werneckii]KAI7605790.1 hypothetical protein KC343_g13626 [Hortaea werneckii]
MCVQASNIIGSNIYRTPDKPCYFTGNKILLGLAIYNTALFVGTKVFYLSINRTRDRQWNGMSREEKEMYLLTTEDKGNKRLDFRFAH